MGWKEDSRPSRAWSRKVDRYCSYFGLAFFLWALASWGTFIIHTIRAHEWLLLIAGSIVGPVGMIYGTGLWFNAW
jgi:hypothetical protein